MIDSGRRDATQPQPDPAWLRRLDDERGTRLDLHGDAETADRVLREWYAPPPGPWIRMNMLGSLNARVVGADGTSDSLSNRADRRVLRTIRAGSDAVVVGASTLRDEHHTPTEPTTLCVVTASGNLTGHRIPPESAARSVLVITSDQAEARARETLPGARVIALKAESGRISPTAIAAAVHEHAGEKIVLEGGRILIGQFLDADLVDEICLTQAPVFGPDTSPSLPGSTRPEAYRRRLLLEDEAGFLYQALRRA